MRCRSYKYHPGVGRRPVLAELTIVEGWFGVKEVDKDVGRAHPVIWPVPDSPFARESGEPFGLDLFTLVYDLCVHTAIPIMKNGQAVCQVIPIDLWPVDENGVPVGAPTFSGNEILAPLYQWIEYLVKNGEPHPQWSGPSELT